MGVILLGSAGPAPVQNDPIILVEDIVIPNFINVPGSGGVTSHSDLTNLTVDDHLHYHTNARGDARYSLLGHSHTGYEASLGNPSVSGYILSSTTGGVRSWIAPPSGGGATAHSALTGLTTGDDHTQYLNNARGDARYSLLSHAHASYEGALGNPAVNGYVLASQTDGTRSWIALPTGGGMVYPAAGIALSTGSTWETSITNNSTNWNTAYSWGNHASGGYLTTVNFNLLFELVGVAPNQYIQCKYPFAGDYEIQAWSNSGWLPPSIWASLPAASTSALGGILLTTTSPATKFLREDGTWQTVTVGSSMVYPGAGVPVSTGSAWTTSLATVNLSSLAGLTYTAVSFVKMTSSGIFTLDTNTYSLSTHNHDSSYISVISTPTNGNIPLMTSTGELVTSSYSPSSFETSISKSTGYAKWTGSAWSFVNESYSLTSHTHAILNMANFTILQESGKIVFKYGSTIIASISSSGALIATNEITAFGTP